MTSQNQAPPALQQLYLFFDQYVALTDAEKDDLAPRVHERVLKRKEFLLREGQVCRHFAFVLEGCFKMFATDKSGKEHNLQFAAEDDWIADISSFYSEKPSKLFIETLEPSRVLLIERSDLILLFSRFPKFVRYFKVIFENKFVEMQDRVLQNISSTAEERYLSFLKHYPHLSNRLPSIQIASYLGVTPEFLSKIRKEVIGK